MDVRRIPVPILLALGLGGCSTMSVCLSLATTEGGTDTSTTGPCLSPPDVGSGLDGSTNGPEETTTGPCLAPEETTTGPCLGIPTSDDSGSSSESSSGSTDDTGTETGTGEDASTSTTTARSDVLERLLHRGVLPEDVAARLQRHTKKA